jgi:surface protein
MFSGCSKLTTIDVSKWSVSKVTNAEYMFNGCQKVTTLDTSLWVANSLNNIRYMFNNCYELQKLDLSGFNTKNVTYLNNMLDGCRKLKELKLGSNFKFEGNGVSRLTLPTPNATYIPGATGKWYSKTTGTAYAPSAVPTLRADTYVAVP